MARGELSLYLQTATPDEVRRIQDEMKSLSLLGNEAAPAKFADLHASLHGLGTTVLPTQRTLCRLHIVQRATCTRVLCWPNIRRSEQ
jgi:hypothetical protein